MTAARKLEAQKPPVVDDDEALDPREIDEIGEEWEAEIERRAEDIRTGRVKGIPCEEVAAQIRAEHGWD